MSDFHDKLYCREDGNFMIYHAKKNLTFASYQNLYF